MFSKNSSIINSSVRAVVAERRSQHIEDIQLKESAHIFGKNQALKRIIFLTTSNRNSALHREANFIHDRKRVVT